MPNKDMKKTVKHIFNKTWISLFTAIKMSTGQQHINIFVCAVVLMNEEITLLKGIDLAESAINGVVIKGWGAEIFRKSVRPPSFESLYRMKLYFQPDPSRRTVPLNLVNVLKFCLRGEGHMVSPQRLKMEVDLQSSLGLHVTWCAQLYPPPPALDSIRGRYWSAKIDDISL